MNYRNLLYVNLCLCGLMLGCGGSDSTPSAPTASGETPVAAPAEEGLPATFSELPANTASGSVTVMGNTLNVRSAVALWMSSTNTLQVELYGVPLTDAQRTSALQGMGARAELQAAEVPDATWGPLPPYASVMIKFQEGAAELTSETMADVRVSAYHFKTGDTPANNVYYVDEAQNFPESFSTGGHEPGSTVHLVGSISDPAGGAVALSVDVTTAIVEAR